MLFLEKFINYRILIGLRKNKNSRKKIDLVKLQIKLLDYLENIKLKDYNFGILDEISQENIRERSSQSFVSMIINKMNSFIFFFLSFNLSLIYPLPKDFLKVIEKEGIKVNFFLSNQLIIILKILNIFKCLIITISLLKKIQFTNQKNFSSDSIFFIVCQICLFIKIN